MKSTIGIYVDDGASLATIVRSLTQEVNPSYIIRSVVAEHLDQDKFFDDLAVFIMPGGADLPYCAKLNGKRNARLRSWVEHGGIYLGLCAGAYYASSKINFHGRDGKISGGRELAFLKGTAVGSITDLAPLYDSSLKSAAVADLITHTGEATAAFYHGGPFFEIKSDPAVKILARYATVKNNPPAIVEVAVNHGKAILSAVHPEVSAKELMLQIKSQENSAYVNRLLLNLKAVDARRHKLWRALLTRCDLSIKEGLIIYDT